MQPISSSPSSRIDPKQKAIPISIFNGSTPIIISVIILLYFIICK